MGPCDRSKREVCAEEGKSISVVKRRKRGGKEVYLGAAEEGIYLAVKVTTNGADVLYRKEGWKETDGARLQVFE